MDFKKTFRKEKEQTPEIIVEECIPEEMEEELEGLPAIEVTDLGLQLEVCRWLGIFPDEIMPSAGCVSKYTIVTEFAKVLKEIGVDCTETCVLSRHAEQGDSFICQLKNEMKQMEITLKHGSCNEKKKLIIREGVVERAYSYKSESNEIDHYNLTDTVRGNSLQRYCDDRENITSLVSGEYQFTIQVNKLKTKNCSCGEDAIPAYHLDNEEKLDEYLLGLTFPAAIDEVYKKVCDISLASVRDSERFMIEVDKNGSTTDFISVHKGQLGTLIRERDKKTISVYTCGDWSYESDELSVKNEDGSVDMEFHITAINPDQIAKTISPQEKFKGVEQEVEKVRQLTKTLYTKKNSN